MHSIPPRRKEILEIPRCTAAYGNATRKLPNNPKQLAKSLLLVILTTFSIQQVVRQFLFTFRITMSDGQDLEAEEFTKLLVYIGFNCVTAEAIVKQGFMSPMLLLTVTEDSLSEMTRQVARLNPPNRVTSPFVSVYLLKGCRHCAASQM